MAKKKIADDLSSRDSDVQKDINDIYALLNSIQSSIDILVKVSERIADNTEDRTGFRKRG